MKTETTKNTKKADFLQILYFSNTSYIKKRKQNRILNHAPEYRNVNVQIRRPRTAATTSPSCSRVFPARPCGWGWGGGGGASGDDYRWAAAPRAPSAIDCENHPETARNT